MWLKCFVSAFLNIGADLLVFASGLSLFHSLAVRTVYEYFLTSRRERSSTIFIGSAVNLVALVEFVPTVLNILSGSTLSLPENILYACRRSCFFLLLSSVSSPNSLHFSSYVPVRDEIIACHTNYRFYAVVP